MRCQKIFKKDMLFYENASSFWFIYTFLHLILIYWLDWWYFFHKKTYIKWKTNFDIFFVTYVTQLKYENFVNRTDYQNNRFSIVSRYWLGASYRKRLAWLWIIQMIYKQEDLFVTYVTFLFDEWKIQIYIKTS